MKITKLNLLNLDTFKAKQTQFVTHDLNDDDNKTVYLAQKFICMPEYIINIKSINENRILLDNINNYMKNFDQATSAFRKSGFDMVNYMNNNFQKIVSQLTDKMIANPSSFSADDLKIEINEGEKNLICKKLGDSVSLFSNSLNDLTLCESSIQKLSEKYKVTEQLNPQIIQGMKTSLNKICEKSSQVKNNYINKDDLVPETMIRNILTDVISCKKSMDIMCKWVIDKIHKYKIVSLTKEQIQKYTEQLIMNLKELSEYSNQYIEILKKVL